MDKKMMAVSTSMLVLKLLEEGDLYGYQMIRLLEERSARVFSLNPILHSLEEQGAVESYEQCAENGRKRKYYHLTKSGGKLLRAKQQEWQEYEQAVRNVLKGGMSFAG